MGCSNRKKFNRRQSEQSGGGLAGIN